MSTKPATIPVWDSGAVNVATPAAGRIASGFPANAIPTSGELNYMFMWLYLWTQYVNDGNFSGAATFASTLGVTGLITATAGVTAGGLVTANAGVSVPTGQNITLAGTAAIKKGSRTKSFDVHSLIPVGTGSQAATYQQSTNTNIRTDFVTAGTPVAASLCVNAGLDNGDRILAVRAYLKDVSGQPALTLRLIGADRAGSGAINGVTATSAASGATQTITLAAVNHTIGTTSVGPVYAHISTASNGSGTYSVFAVEIDYDTP